MAASPDSGGDESSSSSDLAIQQAAKTLQPEALNAVWGMWQVVIMSHSWGDNVFRNFLHWITDLEPDFAEQHLEAYLDIAGPILGVPKSFSALLSGKPRLAGS